MISSFKQLFIGNERSIGQWNPNTTKLHTIKDKQLEDSHWEAHLDGTMGIGMVPILDDNTCNWGAIDIDCHGKDEPEIDLVALESKVQQYELPLVICRTKSGGAHAYCFTTKPVKAGVMQQSLTVWSELLGFKGSEIFPKQAKLSGTGDTKARGNWLNMPYFGASTGKSNRYCVSDGVPVSAAYFLELAEATRISPADLVQKAEGEHSNAPPCIETMMKRGVDSGHRNLALYNAVVYLKRAFPDDYRDRARDFNVEVFDKPMANAECEKVIESASRRDYQYKCHDEPCKSLCKSSLCVKREFGIDQQEKDELVGANLPELTQLVKVSTSPTQWKLWVDGSQLPTMLTEQLINFKYVQARITETLNKIPPTVKQPIWMDIINTMMEALQIEDVPEEGSLRGVILQHLDDYLERADKNTDPNDTTQRQKIHLGTPVIQSFQDGIVAFFSGMAFSEYLRKKKVDGMREHELWDTLKQSGVAYTKLNINGRPKNVWYKTVKLNDDSSKLKPEEYKHDY